MYIKVLSFFLLLYQGLDRDTENTRKYNVYIYAFFPLFYVLIQYKSTYDVNIHNSLLLPFD